MKNLLKAISAVKRRSVSVLLSTLPFLLAPAHAEQKSRENLMVVVRETEGANQQEDAMRPMGKARAKLADGKEIEVDLAFWSFIGDLSVRFVFDGEQAMISATRGDLVALHVNLDKTAELRRETVTA